MKKKILFVLSSLNLGGVETYVARVTPILVDNGFDISIWVINNQVDPQLYKELCAIATVSILSSHRSAGSLLFGSGFSSCKKNYDLVVATGGTALMCVALRLGGVRAVKVVVGVYSQYEFVGPYDVYRRRIEAELFRRLAPDNVFYCTDGCRLDHEKYFGADVKGSIVSPLLIKIQNEYVPRNSSSNSNTIMILSVGRLVDFKTYNITMINVLDHLKRLGYNIHWSVVGSGPFLLRMVEEAKRLGLESNITFYGEVPYSALPDYYKSADLYVGAGTTLIEAASFGLPAICAVDSSTVGESTGFFANRPGIGTSDIIEGDVVVPLLDVVHEFVAATTDNRKTMALASFRAAAQYSLLNSVAEFKTIFNNSKSVVLRLPIFFRVLDVFSICFWIVFGKRKSRYTRI